MRCVFSVGLTGQTPGYDRAAPLGGDDAHRAHAGLNPRPAATRRQHHWQAVASFLRSPLRALSNVTGDLLAITVPADCRHCAAPLDLPGPLPVCSDCLARLTRDQPTCCGRCGEALSLALDLEDLRYNALAQGLLCRECRLAPPPFARAVAFATYRDELRTLIRLLKFEGIRSAVPRLAAALAYVFAELSGETAPNALVIAVPLFAARERQRGFNQSVLVADAALRLRAPGTHGFTAAHRLLTRRRSTEEQFALSRRGRRRNLRGAFGLSDGAAEQLAGREVILVDDILTSGATARECARVLLRGGAAKVWVATLARAQKHVVLHEQADPAVYTARWTAPPEAPGTHVH